MKTNHGFTFIELLIFIIVLGVIAAALAISHGTLFRSSAIINSQIGASKMAALCMDWYLGQRAINGFASIDTITNVPNFCSASNGYRIVTIVSQYTLGDDPNYKTIVVNVQGRGHAKLTTIISSY